MRNPKIQLMKELMQRQNGQNFSNDIFEKSLKKLKRWMKNAFGSLDWDEVEIDQIGFYYSETAKKTDGKKTFNRGFL